MFAAPTRFAFTTAVAAALCSLAAFSSAPSERPVQHISDNPAKPEERVAEQRTILPPGQPAASQETFDTPDDAVKSLLVACQAKDHADIKNIFRPAGKDLVSGDPVEDPKDFNDFAAQTAEHATLEEKSPTVNI